VVFEYGISLRLFARATTPSSLSIARATHASPRSKKQPTSKMADVLATPAATDAFIIISSVIGILFALFQFRLVARISLTNGVGADGNTTPLVTSLGIDTTRLIEIYEAIRTGADSFLFAEYTICCYFLVGFGILVLLLVSCELPRLFLIFLCVTPSRRQPTLPFQSMWFVAVVAPRCAVFSLTCRRVVNITMNVRLHTRITSILPARRGGDRRRRKRGNSDPKSTENNRIFSPLSVFLKEDLPRRPSSPG
jgi:hypothetical protein